MRNPNLRFVSKPFLDWVWKRKNYVLDISEGELTVNISLQLNRGTTSREWPTGGRPTND